MDGSVSTGHKQLTNSIYKFTLGSSGFQIGPTPPANQFQTQNNYNFVETCLAGCVESTHGALAANIRA